MNTVGLPPDMICWVPRNTENADCAMIAIQLACGVTYEDVLMAVARRRYFTALSEGLSGAEVMSVIRSLGFVTKTIRRRRYDLNDSTGILFIGRKRRCKRPAWDHVVYLWAGRIIEPMNETLWMDAKDYLGTRHVSGALITVERKRT